jgi:hypothetical protein
MDYAQQRTYIPYPEIQIEGPTMSEPRPRHPIDMQMAAVRDTIRAGDKMAETFRLSPMTQMNQECLRDTLHTLNCHDDLVAALDGLLNVLSEYVGWRNTAAHEPRETAAENAARAALDKARGGDGR